MNRGWLCLFSFSLAFGDEEGKKEGSDLFSWPRCSWLWLESFTPSVLFRGGWKWLPRSRFISFFPFALFFPSHLVKSNYFGIFFSRPWPILFFITFFFSSFVIYVILFYTNVIDDQCLCEWPDPLYQSTNQRENFIRMKMNKSGENLQWAFFTFRHLKRSIYFEEVDWFDCLKFKIG